MKKSFLFVFLSVLIASCTKKIDISTTQKSEVEYWLTKSDQSVLLQKQPQSLVFGTETNAFRTIEVDSSQKFQMIDGFGFTLTSIRIGSNMSGNLHNVAFQTPDGKKVLIVENGGNTEGVFNIRFDGKWAAASLSAGAVATYVW